MATTEEFFSMSTCPDFISCPCGKQAKKIIAPNEAVHLKGTCWSRDNYTGGGNLKYIKVED